MTFYFIILSFYLIIMTLYLIISIFCHSYYLPKCDFFILCGRISFLGLRIVKNASNWWILCLIAAVMNLFSWCIHKVSLRFMCGTWQDCHQASDLWAHHLNCSPIPQDSCYVCTPWSFTSTLPDTLLPRHLFVILLYNINAAPSHISSTASLLLGTIQS